MMQKYIFERQIYIPKRSKCLFMKGKYIFSTHQQFIFEKLNLYFETAQIFILERKIYFQRRKLQVATTSYKYTCPHPCFECKNPFSTRLLT